MILKDFHSHARGMDDLLNYGLYLEDENVLLNKDGSFLATWQYTGPDLSAASPAELSALAAHVNRAFASLGDGWLLHADSIRAECSGYPGGGSFPDRTTALIDAERRQQYTLAGAHYESQTVLTATYLPPAEASSKAASLFLEGEEEATRSWAQILRSFTRLLEQLEDALSSELLLRRLEGDELLSFLHFCVTGLQHPVRLPEEPVPLDLLLASQDVRGGLKVRIGEKHVRPIAISGFPGTSQPGQLDFLHELPLEYRFSSRFIPLDPHTAERHLERHRTHWFQKRRGLGALARDLFSKHGVQETFSNQDALEMATDADQAKAEASSGLVRFGYYTPLILLFGEDPGSLDRSAREVLKSLRNHGFACQIETLNALEAYLGSLPGHGYPNVRRPLIHSLNFADLMPLTSVWAGLEQNPSPLYPENSPALLYANTSGTTPFRLNLHCGSVGHTLVVGSTGSGKSVLLNLIAAQFLRYPKAQVFFFDKGYSSYVLGHATGADYYEIASHNSSDLSFFPLGQLSTEAECRWAEEWISTLLALQKLELTPAQRNEIHEAIQRLSAGSHRTLTDLEITLQDPDLRTALAPYTLEGSLGTLLDSDRDGLSHGHFQIFEMESLLEQGERSLAPVLLYLFHRIEQRLDGRPTLVILDEAWLALTHPLFREQLEEWLRVLRKRNAAVVLATQTISEIVESPLRNVILESCVTKVFLPNPEAGRTEPTRRAYHAAGLTDREIEIVAGGIPQRDYYVASRDGRRLIDLGLGPVALAFVGAGAESDRKTVARLKDTFGNDWTATWLEERGLPEWASYLRSLAEGKAS